MTTHRRLTGRQRAETLEDRTFLSVSALFIDITGDLQITSHDDDTIVVREDPQRPGRAQVLAAEAEQPLLPLNSLGTIDADEIRKISITGGPGDNVIDLSEITASAFSRGGGVQITADGRNGNDTLIASVDLPE